MFCGVLMRVGGMLFFAMMMFFSAWRWRRFEPEFLVSNVIACVRNPSADSKRCETQNKSCSRKRRRSARPPDRHNHSRGCQPGENIKRVNQLLTARHMLIKPLVGSRIRHGFDAIVRRFAIMVSGPR